MYSININTIYQTCKELQSLVIHLASDSYLNHLATTIADTMVSSPISSPNWIHITIDRPYKSTGELNVFRPSVLRQYFGLTHSLTENCVQRYSYGTGGGINSVGIDNSNFMTRELSPQMVELSHQLHDMLRGNQHVLGLGTVDLSTPFNHCTLLM